MSIPAGVIKCVLHGQLPGGEIWETGFWMSDTGVNSAATANAQAEIIFETAMSGDASGSMRVTLQNLLAPDASFVLVRVYAYPAGGPNAQFIGSYQRSAPIGGGGLNNLPNQCTAVLTLQTGLAGRRHRGRMYLPATGPRLDGDGQLQVATVAAVVDAWSVYFGDINASDAGKIVVVSPTSSSYQHVTQIKMDTRLDIQRRRANSQQVTASRSAAVAP